MYKPCLTAGILVGGSNKQWPSAAKTDLKTVTVVESEDTEL